MTSSDMGSPQPSAARAIHDCTTDGSRIAGRVGEGVSEFVGGTRRAKGETRNATRTRSRYRSRVRVVRSFAPCALVVVAALFASLAGSSCRRAPHFVRGDAAAVVVVQRPKDAGGPPSAVEREPNNTPTQAQELAWAGSPPAAAVKGNIDRTEAGKAVDVDVFKFVVPGQHVAVSSDAGQAADRLAAAKRLSVVINPEAGLALAVDLLDEALRPVKTVAAGPGEVVGLPNMAVLPGCTYYLSVKAAPAPAKGHGALDAGVSVGSSYLMTVLLLDFEIADEREPNDRLEAAGDLSWQGRSALASGLFSWRRDEDWYRLSLDAIDPGWVLNLDLEGVDNVAAGLTVNDSAGRKIVAVRGRKGENLTLRNLVPPSMMADAGAPAASRYWYVVVRAESGVDREHRYVLRVEAAQPEARGAFETEPNDDAAHASPLAEGTTTGYLSVGDVDVFRYLAAEPRELNIEVSPPSRVRAKVEIIRERDGQVLAEATAAKARQTVRIFGFSAPTEPILIRLSQGKHDGNASEPYLLKVTSRPLPRDAGRPD